MDFSDEDFALLYLAEGAPILRKSRNKQTNKHTQMLLISYNIMTSYFRCFTTITRLINHSIDQSSDQSIDRSIN